MKDGPTYARLLPTLVADVWDTYQTVVGLSDLKGHPRDTGRNARVTEFYLSGLLKPHYPVPACWMDVRLSLPQILWLHHDAPTEWVFEVVQT